jgi:hypothetical protein
MSDSVSLDDPSGVEGILQRIARAEILRSLAASYRSSLAKLEDSFENPVMTLEISFKDQKGVTIDPGRKMKKGLKLTFEVLNRSNRVMIYATVLRINGDFSISQVYPRYPGALPERVVPDGILLLELTASEKPCQESLIVIAAPVTDENRLPLDFGWLTNTEETLTRSPGDTTWGRAQANPLGQLLGNWLYPQGKRGDTIKTIGPILMDVRSWRVASD